MSLYLKDPQARIDYAIDWGAAYLDGQIISASEWRVDPEEEGRRDRRDRQLRPSPDGRNGLGRRARSCLSDRQQGDAVGRAERRALAHHPRGGKMMGGLVAATAPALPVSVAELKADARIATSDEEALLAGFARAATDLCERFIGALLIARTVQEIVPASASWTRLGAAPVRSIDGVAALTGDGQELALAADGYAVDIDAAGEGWVRLLAARAEKRLKVRYTAGLATDPNGVPEALRQGIARLALHFHARRDAADPPPAAVTALWRPWRRLRLG